jgi:hypothetical protein
MAVGPLVLPTAKPFSITSAVLQQENSTLWLTNSRHLLKGAHRIGKRTGANGRNNRVKALIGKGKGLRVGQQKKMSTDKLAARCRATFNISMLTSTAVIRQPGE